MAGLLWLGTMGRAMFPQWADSIIMKIPYYKDIVMARIIIWCCAAYRS